MLNHTCNCSDLLLTVCSDALKTAERAALTDLAHIIIILSVREVTLHGKLSPLSRGGEQQVCQVCRGSSLATMAWGCSKCSADQVCSPGCQQESDRMRLQKREREARRQGKSNSPCSFMGQLGKGKTGCSIRIQSSTSTHHTDWTWAWNSCGYHSNPVATENECRRRLNQ